MIMDRTIQVLLVEDDPADVALTKKLFQEAKIALDLTVLNDGVEAMAYLRREVPYDDAVWPELA